MLTLLTPEQLAQFAAERATLAEYLALIQPEAEKLCAATLEIIAESRALRARTALLKTR